MHTNPRLGTERQVGARSICSAPSNWAGAAGSRFSPRSGSSCRNIWSEAQALQCPQRAHTEYVSPNGHPRSLPAPSPRWATHHPRLSRRANVLLQDNVKIRSGVLPVCAGQVPAGSADQRNGWPERQMLCRIVQSFLASATRALPIPDRLAIAWAQSFRPEAFFTRDKIITAASSIRVRASVSPHREMRPLRSTSPD